MSAPIILTAVFGAEDQAWFDRQRTTWFPPERNQLAAHLTMFHHLPPSCADEVTARLRAATRGPAPDAQVAGVFSLGRGVAYRIESDGLERIRADLADAFRGLLTPQDQAGWRAHVTVQNKVEPKAAKALLAELSATFRRRPVRIAGLAAYWYRGGPWEPLSRHHFSRHDFA